MNTSACRRRTVTTSSCGMAAGLGQFFAMSDTMQAYCVGASPEKSGRRRMKSSTALIYSGSAFSAASR